MTHDHHAVGKRQAHSEDDRYDEEFWEDRYRSQPAIWSGRPNPVLVDETGQLAKGTALDVGCGEGGDAIWLAQQGWTVTAVDFATAALDRGAVRARELGLGDRVDWVHADLTKWRPAKSYDLISSHYLHILGSEQQDLLSRLLGAVAPGGTLLYVAHSFEDMDLELHRQRAHRYLPAERIADLLDAQQWEIVVAGNRRRSDAGEHPAGHAQDSVLRARRRG